MKHRSYKWDVEIYREVLHTAGRYFWRSASWRRWWMIVEMVLMTQDILLPDEMVEIFEIMDIG